VTTLPRHVEAVRPTDRHVRNNSEELYNADAPIAVADEASGLIQNTTYAAVRDGLV
jgi:hypothetical protein